MWTLTAPGSQSNSITSIDLVRHPPFAGTPASRLAEARGTSATYRCITQPELTMHPNRRDTEPAFRTTAAALVMPSSTAYSPPSEMDDRAARRRAGWPAAIEHLGARFSSAWNWTVAMQRAQSARMAADELRHLACLHGSSSPSYATDLDAAACGHQNTR